MGNLCARNIHQESVNSDETPLLKAKRNNDSAALLIKKLISAVKDGKKIIVIVVVKSLLNEFYNTSYNLCVCNSQHNSNNSDETALLKAMRNNDSEITAALLIKKLKSTVEDESEDFVKFFLDEIFNPSDVFVKSWSSDSRPEKQCRKFEIWRDAMYIAMEKDKKHSEEIMKLLLGSDIIWSLETKMNDLLLHRLIRRKKKVDDRNLRLIEMLLKSGNINVNARDKDWRTALHLADDEKLISLLIHYGADVNKKDEKGTTPLMPMWHIKVPFLQTILKEAGTSVDLDAIDCNGRTALMIATIQNLPDVVDLLLNAGASVNVSDHLGFTALHHALYTRFDQYDHFPRNCEELKKRKEIFTILFDETDLEIRHEHCDWYREFKKRKEQRMKTVQMLLRIPDVDVNALSNEKFSPLDMGEGWIPQLPSSIKNALKEKGAVLNVFQQTETQSSSRFHLDVRCRLALERLLPKVGIRTPDGDILPVDLFEKRLLTLIVAFYDQIVSGNDQQGRNALHLVAISFSLTWAVYYWRFQSNYDKNHLRNLANTIVKELIKIGCSVNEIDIYGRTPLHYANFISKDSLISHGADASIKDKDGNCALDEIPQQSSTKSSDIIEAVINRKDETYFLKLMNRPNKRMEIVVQVKAYDDKEFCLKTVPKLLWERGEYAFRHPFVKQITTEVIYLMDAIAKEIERLDPRFEIRPEFVGGSTEGTKLKKPDEFDFCCVLTKISELCDVSLYPELPTGFVRLKRKPTTKVDEQADFDSFFGNNEILNTDKLNVHFRTILNNALVNVESQQSLDWKFKMPSRESSETINKVSTIKMIKPLNFCCVKTISIDVVPCIHIDDWWPDEAISNVSDEIKTFGCNLIFESPQKRYPWIPYLESCARISFAKAESDMIKQSCDNAKEAYMIGKTMIEKSDLRSNYILKNSLLYCIEALTPYSEQASQLGLSLDELKSKFNRMDRYLWLKCLMKCHLEFVSKDFCPCYFIPNSSSPIGKCKLKVYSVDWMKDDDRRYDFPELCRKAYALYRCTSNDRPTSEFCYQSPAPDPLWERFNRNQLIASLCEIAYK